MSVDQVVEVAVAVSVAAVALLGALAAWRALARAGAGLRSDDARLARAAYTVPERMAMLRAQLVEVDVTAEHALWMLGKLDARLDGATADLLSKRVASDRLRLQLIDGRLTIARLRQLVRLMMRLGELRRAIL